MMTAAQMSAKIRAKKKAMADGAVKLSGIPEDATDIDAMRKKEPGEELSENMPSETENEDPSLGELRAQATAHDPDVMERAPNPRQINQPEGESTDMDDLKKSRMSKMRASMAKSMRK